MIAPACKHDQVKRHGHDRYGNQRFRCILCGKTWIEEKPKPLGQKRLEKAKAVLCLRLLLEGNSIRSTERITGVHRDTILGLLEMLGRRALLYWQTKMQNLPATDVEVDEIWDYVGCKEKTRQRNGYGLGCGDCYTFIGIERTTKLILAFHVGKRSPGDTVAFSEGLRRAVEGRCQISTDGYQPYAYAIPDAFQGQVDFALIIKIYGAQMDGPGTRYSPAEILDVRMHNVCGFPEPSLVCTSHIERQNLNIRMAVRRMTRLTNAFSKKWANHEYHLALYFLYYNFCRVHMTLKTTPAIAAGVADAKWSVERLLDELA
jgi:IS1 family transposase